MMFVIVKIWDVNIKRYKKGVLNIENHLNYEVSGYFCPQTTNGLGGSEDFQSGLKEFHLLICPESKSTTLRN